MSIRATVKLTPEALETLKKAQEDEPELIQRSIDKAIERQRDKIAADFAFDERRLEAILWKQINNRLK